MDLKGRKIAIVGLGYVGLPLAVEFGKIRPTIGYDLNQSRINELSKGLDNTLEITNSELSQAFNLKFTNSENDLNDCEVFIVTVPTPIDEVHRPNLEPLKKATQTIGKALNKEAVVIFESTVYPGCTEEICVPILEKESGLKYNTDFYCGYSPERINPGDKVNTLTKIKKITSGSTKEAAIAIDNLYNEIICAGTFKAESIKVAEAAKVIENTQRDINIALVNELSVIFERLEIDTLEVLEAAGSKWNFLPFRPGIVGGHCIGVDPYYLTHKAEQVRYNPQVILAGRRINDDMAGYVARKLIQKMVKNGIDVSKSTVAILGVTFKENCPDVRNSKVIDIISVLKDWGINVLVQDPWANPDEVKKTYDISLVDSNDIKEIDAVVVAVGHNQFREMSPKNLKALCKGKNPVIVDLKSLYNRHELNRLGFTVFRL